MTLVILFASLFAALNPFYADDRVATASIVFHVSDERGVPVADATVEASFDMLYAAGKTVSANTDSNGVCRIKGKTVGMIDYRVTKVNHYKSQGKVLLIGAGNAHEKKDGKWQPWNMRCGIIFPRILNPVAVTSPKQGWRTTKICGEWIGFDLREYDFVAPHGSGKETDFEVRFNWDGKTFTEYNGMSSDIRFSDTYSGAYWAEKFTDSEMRGVYSANQNANYIKEFSFSEKIIRDEKGNFKSQEQKLFDESRSLVGRSRCVIDEEGCLKRAQYFQILHMEFACDNDGVSIRLAAFYNPTPNDTNIEPK